jgi:competence protein ComEA
VNLAARVSDGDEIYVPSRGERAAPPVAKRSRRTRATPEPERDVDVNRADAGALGRVPGIGRALAARIVELRERDGPFASLDELLDVGGMSEARLERARPFLRPP